MKTKPFVLVSVVLALTFWMAETAIHHWFFEQGTFIGNLVPSDANELWMRVFITLLFLLFGFVTQRMDDSHVRAEIRRGEVKYRQMVESSPEAIGVQQFGKWVYVNAAAIRLLGATKPENIIGRQVLDFVHPDHHALVEESVRKLLQGGGPTPSHEEKLVRMNGETFMAEVNAMLVEYDGAPAVAVMGRDIEESKRWEEALQTSVKLAEAAREKAEAAHVLVQEQASLLEMFYSHTIDCIALLDKDFNFIRVNEAYARSDEKDVAFFPGKNHFDLYPSDAIEVFKEVVRTKRPYITFARPFVYADHPERGTTYWDWILTPVLDEKDEEIKFLIFTLKNVTDSHNARAELQASESRLQEAQQVAHLGSWELDLVRNILWWSDENYRIFGVEPGTTNTYETFLKTVHPDDQAFVNQAYSSSVKNRAPYDIEHRLLMPDGTVKWVNECCKTVYAEDGTPLRSIGTTLDITQRKLDDEALQASKELLESIIEHAPIRVFWKDTESYYLGCNTAFAHDAGLAQPKELIGKTDFDMGWREEAELYRADDRRVMESGVAKLGYEEPQRTPDGKIIWLRTSKVPMRNTANKVTGILGIYDDITAEKQAERALIHANRALRTISACNSVLVRATSEEDLLNEMCQVLVQAGGYLFAWVGFAEHDSDKTVRAVARSSYEEGYLGNIRISWADTELGHGPTGTAIRTGTTIVNQDMESNPAMAPWRGAAIQRGYQSSVALPLVINKRVLGALTIYSAEPNAFVAEELELLEELVSDMAYGIATLRTRIEREKAEQKLKFMAHHDPLTGLPNRLLLQDRFDHATALANREQSDVALLFLDLDNFKHINDSLGHAIGDQLLVCVVERLRKCIRGTDTISRQGGDEFIILLTGVLAPEALEIIAQNIIEAFADPFEINGLVMNTSFSIGISLYPNDGKDFDTLLQHADTALYQAKDAGRNTYRFFTNKMNIEAQEHMHLQGKLRNAIRQHEFLLHYQPQIDIDSKRIIGAEALVRWQHPEAGMIPPGKFIPLAERSGLIIPIGEWVLNEACRQAQAWRETPQLKDMVMAVNLSALQFKRGNIVETVTQALARSGLPAHQLELELTESILLHDIDVVMTTLQRLKKIGVKLSIDDFGTGYSSLTYLKRLKVDKLKVDQSFVRDMVQDSEDAAIVKAIIQLGHNLQLTVIAEGVEKETQLALLRDYGCDEIQGYLFSRPLPAQEFIAFCRR